jgi:hypothetical protein
MCISIVQCPGFNDLSFGVSLLSDWKSKEVKMPKERSWDTPLRQMSLRLANEPQPMLSEAMREELIFALATLLFDVANSDDVAEGVIKDEH